MDNILQLYLFLVIGLVLRSAGVIDETVIKFLNKLLIWLFIPVITLMHLPAIQFEMQLLALSLTPFILFIVAWCYVRVISSLSGDSINREMEGALVITSGISSVSFIGFPVAHFLYGEIGLTYAIIASTAGTFLVFNTLGFATVLGYSMGRDSLMSIIKRVLSFPPLIAFFLGFVMWLSNSHLSPTMVRVLSPIVALYPAVAFTVVGAQFQTVAIKAIGPPFLVALVFKLFLAPLVTYLVLFQVIGMDGVIAQICVLMAGAGSMHAAAVMASELGLNSEICRMMPSISLPLSLPLLLLLGSVLQNDL